MSSGAANPSDMSEKQPVDVLPAPTPTEVSDPTDQQANGSVIEDLRPQLLPEEDMSVGSVDGSRHQKRRADEVEEGQESKRRRREPREEDEDMVRVSLVVINGMVTAVQGLTGQMKRNESNEEKFNQGLTEANCSLGKIVAALHTLQKTMEDNEKERSKREESWLQRDLKREEEKRKEIEADQRRLNHWREAEKKEREELKSLLKKALNQQEESKGDKEEPKGDKQESKENVKPTVKSKLGKSYTENTMRDHSKKN